jgi:hypothetical protein
MSNEEGQKITIEGLTPDMLVDSIMKRLSYDWDIQGKIREKITDRVREETSKLVDQITHEQIKSRIEEVITDGWEDFDSYGKSKGSKTLAQRVDEILQGVVNSRGGYSSQGKPRIEKLVADAVENYLNNTLREDLVVARESFKTQVNTVLQAKLGEVLGRSLGLDI